MEETKEQRKARKAIERFKKEQHRLAKEFPGHQQDKATILCVRFGNKYGIGYVEKLRNMIARNCTVPYQLVCLTDDNTPIEGVKLIVQKNAGYSKGWWHKIHMFNPDLPLNGRILYMDLDVVICNNIDKLTQISGNLFMGIRDFNRKFHPHWKYLNSSVMSWIHGRERSVYDSFIQNPSNAQRMHGDQDWTWKSAGNRIKFWPEQWIQSYKWEIRNRDELQVIQGMRQFKTVNNDIQVPNECCICVFHGDPNPAHVQDKFVLENWR